MKKLFVDTIIFKHEAKKFNLVFPKGINGEKFKVGYHHIPKDKDGWVDPSLYLPKLYDLCNLKLSTGTIKVGWLIGENDWMGRSLKEDDEVIAWKKGNDEN